jgi:hypothetical protein
LKYVLSNKERITIKKEKMQITVEIKNVYGVERIYAVCNNAKLITKLKQSKTLSKEDISILREMGYKIETKQPTI